MLDVSDGVTLSSIVSCVRATRFDFMRYKVTAVKDVIILAHVRKHPPGYDGPIQQPTESIMWVPVFANKPVDGLGMILGIDPRFVKDAPIKTKDGFSSSVAQIVGNRGRDFK